MTSQFENRAVLTISESVGVAHPNNCLRTSTAQHLGAHHAEIQHVSRSLVRWELAAHYGDSGNLDGFVVSTSATQFGA